jgi:chemotaxis methyl-accepting protein methylase
MSDLDAILVLLEARRGVHFGDYRRDVIERRVAARVEATRSRDLDGYLARLEEDAAEADALFAAIALQVTGFFREPAGLEALAAAVVGRVAPSAPPGAPLRVWVAGCATGEEAWSVAMVLAEALEGSGGAFELVATDLDARAVAEAARGAYPVAAVAAVPPALRSRHLELDGHGAARIAPGLRARARFAQHDLVGRRLAPKEAIVASFDVVVCRNVLLYFSAPLRARAVERLAVVTRPGGALLLGAAESLADGGRPAFDAAPSGARIYFRRADAPAGERP